MLGRYSLNNNVRVTLHTAINAVASSLVVDAASGVFQNPADPNGDAASGGVAIATLYDSLLIPTKVEILTYTSLTDNGDGTLTLGGVTRGQEGTTAQSFGVGAVVTQAVTTAQLVHPYVVADQAAGTLDIRPSSGTTVTGDLTQRDGASSGWRMLLSAGALAIAKYASGFKSRWKVGPVTAETGSGDTGSDLAFTAFSDAGGSLGNAVTIKRSSGNVGVGTAPDASRKLTVSGDVFASNLVAASGGYLGCYFSGIAGTFDAFKIANTVVFGGLSNISMSATADGASYHTAFTIAPSTGAMTIPAATVTSLTIGSMVYGTQPGTPPAAGGAVSIAGTGSDALETIMRFSADANGPILALAKARGSVGTPALVADNDVIGSVVAYSATTSSAWKEAASIRFEADGSQSTLSVPTAIVFETTLQSSSSPSEALRINSLGQIIFGSGFQVVVSGISATALSTQTLSVTGQAQLDGGANTGSLDVRSDTTSQTAPTTSVNNVSLAGTTHIIRLTGTGGGTWTGLVAGGPHRLVTIFNKASSAVTLAHENTSSTAANRFSLPGNANYSIPANDSVTLWYDSSSARWCVLR